MREGGAKGLLKKIIEERKRKSFCTFNKSWIVIVFFFWFRWTEPRFVTPKISRRGIAVRHLPRKWQRSAQSGIVRYRKKHWNILVSFIIQIFFFKSYFLKLHFTFELSYIKSGNFAKRWLTYPSARMCYYKLVLTP